MSSARLGSSDTSNVAPCSRCAIWISLAPCIPIPPEAVGALPEDTKLCCWIYPIWTFRVICHRLVYQVKSCILVQILDELSACPLKKESDTIQNRSGRVQ